MQTSELTQLHYHLFSSKPNELFPPNFTFTSNTLPNYNQFINNTLHLQTYPQSTNLINSNSTSDEEYAQRQIIDERKQRRIISNRESARRSRVRKQKQLHELRSQIVWLRNENRLIVEKLNRLMEDRDRIMQENVLIKEESLDLRRIIDEMKVVDGSYNDGDGDGDDTCSKLN